MGWLIGLGVLALVAAIVVGYVLIAKPFDGGDGPSGTSSTPGHRGTPITRDVVDASTERLTFKVFEEWEYDAQTNVTSVLSGYTVFDTEGWLGRDTPGAEAREIFSVKFYGQEAQPRTQEVPADAVDAAMDQGVDAYRALTPEQLQGQLQTVGHGCFSDAQYAVQPARFDPDGLKGLKFEYTCLAGLDNEPERGLFVMLIDKYGDRHQVTLSTDQENFENFRSQFEDLMASIAATY